MIPLHARRTHPEPVPGCYACKLASVQVAAGALETRRHRDYATAARVEAEGKADRDAYRRLRREGLQPRTIAGSAHLERHADTWFEVETGRLYPGQQGRQLADALSICADAGFDPRKPAEGQD